MKQDQSKTFSQWMDQFCAEQEAINKADAKHLRRQEHFGKLRTVVTSLAGVALLACAYVYSAGLGRWLHDKTGFGSAPMTENGGISADGGDAADNKSFKEGARENFGNKLKAAQDFAKERDRLLAEMQGGDAAAPAPAANK